MHQAKLSTKGMAIRKVSAAAALCAFSLLAAQAVGQSQRNTIEEIVVTATKRNKSDDLQRVPIAATVVTEAQISASNFVDVIEVSRTVPNASFRETASYPGTQRFWMRGTGTNFSTPNFDPAVAVYQDGVFVAQNIAAILDTFDLASIEVLRGPQGTLFGRNTSAGAIVANSRRPGDELEVRLQATLGSYGQTDISASVGGPLARNFNVKLAAISRESDGWLKNTFDGDNIGSSKRAHLRGTGVWDVTDTLSATLIVEDYERSGDGAWSVNIGNCDGRPCDTNNRATRAWNQTYDDHWPFPSHTRQQVGKQILTLNWQLGHGALTSISGAIDVEAFGGGQFDGREAFIIASRTHIDQEQFSQELRYAATVSESFNYTAGLFYFDQQLSYGEQRAQGSRIGVPYPDIPQGNPYGLRPPGYSLLDHTSWGVFAEASIALSAKLELTIGGRYSQEDKHSRIGIVNYGSCAGQVEPPFIKAAGWRCTRGTANGFDIDDSESWDAISPKLALQYQVNEDFMLYSSLSRGFRSGGFSMRVGAAELSDPSVRAAFYDRERVEQLEVGVRSDLADGAVRLNATAFHQQWDGIQRNIQQSVNVQKTANVEKSHVSGVELELNAIIGSDLVASGDQLRLDGSFGKIWTGYDSAYLVGSADLRNQDFASPDLTAFASLTYRHAVRGLGGSMNWKITYQYISDWNVEGPVDPSGRGKIEAQSIVDASIAYSSSDGRWQVRVFGKNLLNDQYYVNTVPAGSVGWPGAPRSYGVTAVYQY